MDPDESYNDFTSQTSKKTDYGADVEFGSGDLGGRFFYDNIQIGEGEHAIKIENQIFGNVEEQHHIFMGDFEAIVGMAYPSLAEKGTQPLFDNMISQHLLKDNIFAFYLSDDPHGADSESELTFGYYDKTRFVAPLVWHPVVYKSMFALHLDDILMGGKSLGFCNPNCTIVPDSGTSYMSLPSYLFDKTPGVMPTISRSMRCESIDDFGDLTFVINGVNYDIPASEWLDISPSWNFDLAQVNSYRVIPHSFAKTGST